MKNTHSTESRLADLIRTAPHAHSSPIRDALLALALFAGLLGFILNVTTAVAPPPLDDPIVALGTSHMGDLEVDSLTSTGAGSFSTVTGSGAGAFASLSTTGDITSGDDFLVSAQTVISPTDTATITPTGTYQPLSSAGAVTVALSASGYTAGSLLVLINTSNTTILISDTGTTKASSAVSLAQYDAALLWFDGTNWIQIGESDN